MNIIFECISSSFNKNINLNKDNNTTTEYKIGDDITINNQIELTNPDDQKEE